MKVVIYQKAGMIVRIPLLHLDFILFSQKLTRFSLDQEWKHSCYLHCLAPVLDAISQPSLDYATVLQLDKRIREFSIPDLLRNKDTYSRSVVMQNASLSTALEAGMFFLIVENSA